MEKGMAPEKISELNFVLEYDDDTPPSKMTILDPNLTWGGNESPQSQKVMIVNKTTIASPGDDVIYANATIDATATPQPVRIFITPSTPVDEPMKYGDTCGCESVDEIVEELQKRKIVR
jgi:hypothetical protein